MHISTQNVGGGSGEDHWDANKYLLFYLFRKLWVCLKISVRKILFRDTGPINDESKLAN